MIGAAVLLTGLLLILAGTFASRLPDGASFASSGIARSRGARLPVRAFLLSPIHPTTWYANAAIAVGPFVAIAAFGAIASLISAGLTVLLAGIGVVVVGLAIEGARIAARVERRRAFLGEPARPAAHAYRPLRGGVVGLLRAEFGDESRWRDLLYVAVDLPLAFIEALVVALLWLVALALTTMPIWYDLLPTSITLDDLGPLASHDPWIVLTRTLAGLGLLFLAGSVSQLVIALHRGVVRALICTSESRELRRQVETLRESRSAVLDVEASELHRIERDLHDGAQQRLVMLTIDLGLAAEKVATDPDAARRLILDGQAEAREALAEIRQLVRGIAPAILVDRGLVPALESIAGRGPVPIAIRSELAAGDRLPVAVERAAYFVVSEALANVAKHSGATGCEVRIRREWDALVVEVRDDGRGGAHPMRGGGLEGLAGRVAGVDGTFDVTSPPGGPTLVRATIPLTGSATS